jgi:hypothetical protein
MHFFITSDFDISFLKSTEFRIDLYHLLENHFHGKDYGRDVQGISLILYGFKESSIKWDRFKIRKPRMNKVFPRYNSEAELIELEHVFCCEYLISKEKCKILAESDDPSIGKEILISSVMDSLNLLDQLPKRISDFDKISFESDVKDFLKKR